MIQDEASPCSPYHISCTDSTQQQHASLFGPQSSSFHSHQVC
jgi:hypothetical protein